MYPELLKKGQQSKLTHTCLQTLFTQAPVCSTPEEMLPFFTLVMFDLLSPSGHCLEEPTPDSQGCHRQSRIAV